MNISKLLNYKVVEFDKGICILPAADKLGGRQGVNEMIIADITTCCEYLARYTHARGNGKNMNEAHEEALRGAITVVDFSRVVQ